MSVQPESNGNGSASPVAGAADLQTALDSNTRAINQLASRINEIDNGNGTSTTVSNSTMAEGAQFTTGSQNRMATNLGGGSGSNNGGGFLSSISNAFGGGSGGTGSTTSGGSLANFSITKTGSLIGSAANIASSLINASGAIGQGMGQDVLQQSTYGYITQNAGYTNNNGGIISAQQAQTAAFGSAASGQLNRLATGTSDASTGAAILTQMSNSPNFASNIPGMASPTTGYGTAPWTLASSVGMANPGLGETGSANVANALISPTASYNLQMMGVSTQPIGIGGKVNSLQSVYGSIASRLMGQQLSSNGTMNQQQLTTNLNDPLMAYQMMQATGMTADEYQQWANSWEQQNQAASSKNISLSTVQNDISQFMSGKMSSSALQKATGINGSAWENTVQSQSATNMGAENDNSAAFVQGLQSATTAINALTVMMGAFLSSMGGAGAKVSGASAAAGISIANGNLASTSLGSTVTEGAALAGVSSSAFSSALSSALGSAVSSFDTGNANVTPTADAGTAGSGKTPAVNGKGGTGALSYTGTGKSVSAYGVTISSLETWIDAFLTGIGAPINAANTQSMRNWVQHEHGLGNTGVIDNQGWSWGNNPLDVSTTLANQVGVKPAGIQKGTTFIAAFDTELQGVESNVKGVMIDLYTPIVQALRAGKGLTGGTRDNALGKALQTWSGAGYYSAAQGGQILVGERGPELLSFANGGVANITPANVAHRLLQGTSAMPAGAPWTAANRLLSGSFSGQKPAGNVHVTIEKGAVQMGTNYQGVFTSQDAQSAANQFTQALEKSLGKSQVLQAIANGVTG